MPTFRHHLRSRFAVLAIIVVGVLGVLLVRLWTMQVLSGAAYAEEATKNRVREVTTAAPRGRILDRNGVELVTNRATLAVTMEPGAQEDEEMLIRLSALLGKPVDEIVELASSKREAALKPRTIAVDVPLKTVAYIGEHPSLFPGVDVEVQAVREYPNGAVASHVLGYTGEVSEAELAESESAGYQPGDIVGKAGVEKQFESVLQGERGYRRLEVDAAGRAKRVIEEADPIPGRDVKLTLDLRVQRIAEKALKDALADAHREKFPRANAGAAVAVDVKTGEVIAMASLPAYDPRSFLGGISQEQWKRLTDEKSDHPLTNRAIMAQYPPASTFKAFTGLAGLETGITSQWKTYDCQGRWTGMGEEWKKYCWNRSGHGIESFVEGITDSCDTVFYEIGYGFESRGREELQKFARRFGFGSPTGIDLPGEADGRVPDAAWKKRFNRDYPEYQRWLPGDTVNMAIGQGDMLVTPLQLACAYAGIANGGKVQRPHVLSQVLGADGRPTRTFKPEVAFDAKVSADDLAVMDAALRTVTTQGTAEDAFRGFDIAVTGKTGTAQVAGKDDYAWFVGYAPSDEPRYAVAVVVEQGGHGGSVAAPAARSIFGALLGGSTEHVTAEDESR